jgi:hypothetical protein
LPWGRDLADRSAIKELGARDAPLRRSPGWPFFLGWLLVTCALWFAERRLRAAPVSGNGAA